MANPDHLRRLQAGVEPWNHWRRDLGDPPDLGGVHLQGAQLPGILLAGAYLRGADLRAANLAGANLRRADLSAADLARANLQGAYLAQANLARAQLTDANLRGAHLLAASLVGADLTGADLTGASLVQSHLARADLSGVILVDADLSETLLVRTRLAGATLAGCRVYGVTAWDVDLTGAVQRDLRILPGDGTRGDGPPRDLGTSDGATSSELTVDDLEVAQFVYLLLRNATLRRIVDTVTAKAVLLLGRFTRERAAVLGALRDALRARGLVPIIFDFDGPESRDVGETVRTLAHLSRFIVADLTEPRSVPQELVGIVPHLPSVPVLPLLEATHELWGMWSSVARYPWVLAPYRYTSPSALAAAIDAHVIAPAEQAVAHHRPPRP